jgi:peptidoglycan/LPS O-acetylase OafA/YrhL
MKRILEFDALRGVAAMAIVVNHIWFPDFVPMTTGVYLFFILSGYLITSIILKNLDGPNFLAAFFGRRSLRIWPIYYLALAVVVGFNVVSPRPERLDALPYFLTYTQNIQEYWFGGEIPFIHGFQHTWTLAIEEQFYLVWPLLIVGLGRRAVLPMSIALVAISIVARGLGFGQWILLTQADGFGLGGLLAVAFADSARLDRSWSRYRVGFAVSGIAAAGFAAVGPKLLATIGIGSRLWSASFKLFAINVVFFSVVGLVSRYSGHRLLKPLRARLLVYLGQISYGIYLYHYILLCAIRTLLDHAGLGRPWWSDLGIFAATLGISALSWAYVERPILKLKDRFAYRTTPDPAHPAIRPAAVGPEFEPVPAAS